MLDMTGYSLISADSHVIEPPDLFSARLPTKLRNRAPRLARASGTCRWSVGSESAPLPDSVVNGSGWRRPPHGPRSFEDVLPALYDPSQRLLAQDADGVAAEVLYPFPGLWDAIRATGDHELILGCVRAYNDWIAEFSAHSPHRLVGLGRIPMTGLDDARDELLRCVKDLGLRGIILDAWPGLGPAPGRGDDGFWEVVNETQVPVSIHYTLGGSSRSTPVAGIAPGLRPPMADAALPLVAAGIFDRFPNVRFVLAHGDAGWATHWLEFTDINYVRHRHLAQYQLQNADLLPSEYLRRHFWFTIHQDRSAVKNRHKLGRSHLLWSSHFPLDGADWPDDRRQAIRLTEELPAEERGGILGENVARLYRLPGFEDGFAGAAEEPMARLVYF
jgi:predicted TIM-barrel fold metal-dependent hydrolase